MTIERDAWYWYDLRRMSEWLARPVELGSEQPVSLALHWGEWLKGYDWQAWGTLTLRYDEPTHDQMQRAWSRFVAWLRTEGNQDVSYFVGHEVGSRGRVHLHCLLGTLAEDTPRSALWSWWYERFGRAEIRGYDPERGAASYVSKYVTKELAHYDLDLRGFDRCGLSLKLGSPSWKRTRDRKGSAAKPPERTPPSPGGPNTTA